MVCACASPPSCRAQVKAIKEGKSISKPIYNHVNGTLDENENIEPTPIVIFEGLHPFHDKRVDDLMDFKIYVDITPEVKFNWKVQRDHEERGHSIERYNPVPSVRTPHTRRACRQCSSSLCLS